MVGQNTQAGKAGRYSFLKEAVQEAQVRSLGRNYSGKWQNLCELVHIDRLFFGVVCQKSVIEESNMTSNRLDVYVMLSACLLVPFAAEAAGLGDIRVISSLGDRLRVEIPLLSPLPSIDAGCFHLTTDTPDAIADVSWVVDAQVALLAAPPRLLIRTRRPVVEPVIQLAIYTGCGTFLTRHYTALLSPPPANESNKQALETNVIHSPRTRYKTMERIAQPGESAGDMARRLFPRNSRVQQLFLRRFVALNPEWLSSESVEEVLPEGVDLHYPPPPPKPPLRPVVRQAVVAPPAPAHKAVVVAVSKPIDHSAGGGRLVISPTDPLPTESAVGQASPGELNSRLSEANLKVATMRAELDALRANYPAAPPAIATTMIEIETRLLAVELSIARISLANLAAAKAASNATPNPEPQVVVASSEAAASELTPSPALENKSSQTRPDTALLPVSETSLALLGIFGFGIALSIVLYRRTKLNLDESVSERALSALFKSRVEAKRSKDSRSQAIDDEVNIQPDFSVTDGPVELGESIEVADILLAYGRTQGAIELLQSMIEANPEGKESLQLSMRLLEIYQQANMRQEFELLADQLSHHFNIESANWDEVLPVVSKASVENDTERQRPRQIENMPEHIKTRVANQWGTLECLGFLQKLLSDNRDGARKGFPVSVTYTIMGLIKALEAELKTPPRSHNV